MIQAESAVRAVVSARWYDGDEHGRNSLRGDMDAVAELLATTIQEHVALAGLEVVEARISHLAYAPEIASAMLRRQQAEAVVAARARIVDGAVGMVKLGIEQLEAAGVVQLSAADRVQLVTNLMTVLVSENETHPVLSVGRGLAWPYWRALPCSAAHCSPGRWPGRRFPREGGGVLEAEIQASLAKAKPQQISYGGLITVALNEPPRISLDSPDGRAGIATSLDVDVQGNPPPPTIRIDVAGRSGFATTTAARPSSSKSRSSIR